MANINLQDAQRRAVAQEASVSSEAARIASASTLKRKPEEESTDLSTASGPEASVQEAPAEVGAADTPVDLPAHAAAEVSSGVGSSALAVAGGLGLLGVIAAAAGGGGGSHSPVAVQAEPLNPQPAQPVPVPQPVPQPQPVAPEVPKPDHASTDPTPPASNITPPAHTDPGTPVVPTTPTTDNTPPAHPDPATPVVPTTPADTTPPERPTLALKNDTGTDHTDGITSDSTITVSGLEQDATWRYSSDAGKTWQAGSGTELKGAIADGAHEVQVIQTDKAGNDSAAQSLHFTLDTGAPTPTLALKNDTGTNHTDGITSDSTISVSGLEQGATWRYSLDGSKTWHVGSGSELTNTLYDGAHDLQVIQTDKAGNDSAMASLHFTLDTDAPTLALKNDTGRQVWDEVQRAVITPDALQHDGITKDGTLTVSGLEEGANWMYSADGGQSWKTGVGKEIAASELGADGQKTVLTKQMTASMTESGISAFSFVLDTHVDSLTNPRLKSVDYQDKDGKPVTSHPVVVFDGYEADSAIQANLYFLSSGFTQGETVMGGELALDLQPGNYEVSGVLQTDLAGNASLRSYEPLQFTVVVPPVLP